MGIRISAIIVVAFVVVVLVTGFFYLKKYQKVFYTKLIRVKNIILDSGTLKVMLIYMQTTASLNSAWPEWVFSEGLRYLGVSNLSMTGLGLECLLPFMANPVNNFLSHMLIVPGITVGLIVMVVLHKVVRYLWNLLFSARSQTSTVPSETSLLLSLHGDHHIHDDDDDEYAPVLDEFEADNEDRRAERTLIVGQASSDLKNINDSNESNINSNKNNNEDVDEEGTRKEKKEVVVAFNGGIVWRAIYVWMYSLYFLYFELANRSLAVFNCDEEIFTGRLYMQSLPWLQCHHDTEWWTLRTMAIVSTVVYVAGIPLFFGSLLMIFRKRLAEAKVRYALGHLYYCYRPGAWWLWLYEMAIIIRRLALAILISVVPRDSPYRTTGIVVALLVAFVVQRWLQPFLQDHDNTLEELAIMTVLFTFVGQTFWSNFNLLNVVATYQISMVDNADLIVLKGEGSLFVVIALVANGLIFVALLGFLVWPLLKLIWRRLVANMPGSSATILAGWLNFLKRY